MAGFWDRPREQRWRGWVFQIHLWTGLLVGLWALAMGLSGSALVFHHEISAAVAPELFVVEPRPGRASLDAVKTEVERRFPDYSIVNFRGLEAPDRSHIVRIVRHDAPGGLAGQRHVHYDPYSGEILGSYNRRGGLFGFFQDLHYYLLAGPVGIRINGLLGLALLLMCLTGVVIWWPGRKSWRRGLSVKLGAGWKRVNYDLHSATGVFTAAVLALMAFTGFYFGFPGAVGAALAAATGGGAAAAGDFLAAPASESSSGAPLYSLDALVERRDELLPPGFELAYITLPKSDDGAIAVAGRRPGNPVLEGYGGSYVDRVSGVPLKRFDSREQPLGLQATLAFAPIHFGEWGGVVSKALWFALGFAPAGLFATGFLMWWNRVAGQRYRAWRGGILHPSRNAR